MKHITMNSQPAYESTEYVTVIVGGENVEVQKHTDGDNAGDTEAAASSSGQDRLYSSSEHQNT